MRQHVEAHHTGELLEQVLLTLAAFTYKKGVYGKAIELCAFIISRYPVAAVGDTLLPQHQPSAVVSTMGVRSSWRSAPSARVVTRGVVCLLCGSTSTVTLRSDTFRNSLVVAAWRASVAMANTSSFPLIAHTNLLNLAMATVKGQALVPGEVMWTCKPCQILPPVCVCTSVLVFAIFPTLGQAFVLSFLSTRSLPAASVLRSWSRV